MTPPGFAPVRVDTPHGPVDLVGELTAVPSLLLVPAVSASHGGYTGLWLLVHTPTGLCLPCADLTAARARSMADRIAAAGLAWSTLPDDVTERAPYADAVKAALVAEMAEASTEAGQ